MDTAANNRLVGKLAGKTGLAVVDLGLAMSEILQGFQLLRRGSPVAKKFETAAGKLKEVHLENEETYHYLIDKCEAEGGDEGVDNIFIDVINFSHNRILGIMQNKKHCQFHL